MPVALPMRSSIPKLYPILDAGFLPREDRELFLASLAGELLASGVALLQYRNKRGSDAEILADARLLRTAMPAGQCRLILNDRADLAVLAGFDGVHVGQQDLSPQGARRVVGPEGVVGVSTHNPAQLRAAALAPVDYLAIGPVFETASKENPDPVVGIEGVRQARSIADRPLVAIGGISLENCRAVLDAGANSVAVLSAVFQSASGDSPGKVIRDFLAIFK